MNCLVLTQKLFTKKGAKNSRITYISRAISLVILDWDFGESGSMMSPSVHIRFLVKNNHQYNLITKTDHQSEENNPLIPYIIIKQPWEGSQKQLHHY